MKEIVYYLKSMEKFMEEDAYIRFVVKDLMRRGHTREKALEIAFNTVLDDHLMVERYQKINDKGEA
ncbi:hypothetical protein [Gracilibacillus sp. YIM 98692]|uniref:hypothetical protein n=1 Tax=Gracilibacillus sp. YIM 98692 TaxID=2663532 RepID=UPI0013D35BD9|nr:hypothetical protein [Gracilibacillus sp. YIM 98692]